MANIRGEIIPPSKPTIEVTFAIAALNEERLIADFVTQAHATVAPLLDRFEFILVDDGSSDRTGAIMEELAQSLADTGVLHNPVNQGLGECYKRALRQARYPYYMLLCGDGGLPAASLPPILAKVGEADMVLPYITNLRRIKSPLRYALSRGYTGLLNLLFGLDVKYYNGLPVHRVDLLRGLAIGSAGFGFQAEIIIKLIRSGHSYTQVGVEGSEKSGRSRALRPGSVLSVASTFATLVREIAGHGKRGRDKQRAGSLEPD